MTKEQQNLSWACLPKEVREEIKKRYKTLSTSFLTERYMELNNLFGHHNLTSDIEPEEMLIVERKKVQEEHKCHMGSNEYGLGYTDALEDLFGDKCLPDTPNTPNSGELKSQKSEIQPKFKVGDKVYVKFGNLQGEIRRILTCKYFDERGWGYDIGEKVNKKHIWFNEYKLEPYTKPL